MKRRFAIKGRKSILERHVVGFGFLSAESGRTPMPPSLSQRPLSEMTAKSARRGRSPSAHAPRTRTRTRWYTSADTHTRTHTHTRRRRSRNGRAAAKDEARCKGGNVSPLCDLGVTGAWQRGPAGPFTGFPRLREEVSVVVFF